MFTRRQDSAAGRAVAGEAGDRLLIPRESRGLRHVAYSVTVLPVCKSGGPCPRIMGFLLLKHFMILRLAKLN